MAELQWLLGCLIIVLWSSATHSVPPPPPVLCNQTGCTLHNSYGVWNDRKDCIAPQIIYPKTEPELISAIANANKNNLKVKVVTKFSHSIPKLACPDGGKNSIFVSTGNYDPSIEINVEKMIVTAGAGVDLRRLVDEVEKTGLSLVAAPYWEGVSVGGMVSTGAHGSSWWGRGGAVHDHVVSLRLVVPAKVEEGYAKVVVLEAEDALFDAAIVSLGMLGVISKVSFSLERGFKRSIRYNFTEDGNIEEELMEHPRRHEFGDIQWYPSKHTAVYRYDDRLPINSTGDGVNDFLGFQPNPILISKSVRSTEKAFEKARNVKGKCTMAASFVAYKKLTANGLKNNLIFTGYPVVGRQSKMQTSGSCLYSPETTVDAACAWDPRFDGLFFYETTAIFSPQNFRNFIKDVKTLREVDPDNFCGADIYNGFLIRYIKSSTAYLGQSEDSIVVDFNYYRANDPFTPRLNQDVWEEVEQMAFFKHGAKPHWGKNRNLAFLGVEKKYPKMNRFVEAKREMDPKKMFSSEWLDEIVFGIGNGSGDGNKGDGCALEGLCVCSEDSHCSPSKGYFCQSGLVYKQARVCRYSRSSVA